MSYVRFSEDGSNVYIYNDVRGYVICCGCLFGGMDPGTDFHTTELDEMLFHIKMHRIANHYVPEWVDEELRKRWPVWEGTDND